MRTIGNKRNILKFRTDPFYLYPVKEEMIDQLFVDREEEINITRSILIMRFKDIADLCAVVGGIGVGKSSLLYYIANIAKEAGYNVDFYNNPDDFYSESKKNNKNLNHL